MKKVLFATTALVASAGIASAQGVEVTGYAEMGIFGGEDATGASIETQFHTDIDVTFTMSGETDNGLTFGASIDLDESDGTDTVCTVLPCTVNGDSDAFDADRQGGESVFLSGNFGTITMGDTDGAFDWALTEAIIGGAIQDDHEHAGYSGNAGLDGIHDGQVARYDYSFGDFAFAVSAEIDDAGAAGASTAFGIGGRYSGDLGGVGLGVGLGYQTGETGGTQFDIIGISLDATFDNGIQAILNYSDLDGYGGNDSHMGVAFGYSMDALTIAVNYGVFDRTVGADNEGYGLIVNYDLGGGAEVQFGYGHSDRAGTTQDTFSLGVAMTF
ncbi:MAG: porin [Rhodobacter sp.]|nr:porin [Rhodobacter sp.]